MIVMLGQQLGVRWSDDKRAAPVMLSAAKHLVTWISGQMSYYVYIMSSASRTLYVGVTNNLERRVYEHKQKTTPGFTAKYDVTRLVYFEETSDVRAAIEREKQLKGWRRSRKIALITASNPDWQDLGADGGGRDPSLRSG